MKADRLIETFQELVAIDSPTYGEKRMAEYLKNSLTLLGLHVSEDDAGEKLGGNCGNLCALLKGNKEGDPLLFCTHMDTVEPSSGKKAVIGADGVIRSAGDTVLGADDAAGISAILEAVETLIEENLPHPDITLLFTVAEEAYARGAGVFDFTGIDAKTAYILDYDGEAGEAVYAAPTILPFTVAVEGKSAHAGFAPEQGIHAISVASQAISQLKMGRVNPDTTVNIGLIEGGTATNIVPNRCTVKGEIRSYSHPLALEQLALIRKVFEEAAAGAGATVCIEEGRGIRAYETPRDCPAVHRFERACASLGLATKLVRTFGGSDNNVLAQRGIQGLVLSSAMHRCHTCEEFTTVDELTALAQLTLKLMTID